MKKIILFALLIIALIAVNQNAQAHHNSMHTKTQTGKTEKSKED